MSNIDEKIAQALLNKRIEEEKRQQKEKVEKEIHKEKKRITLEEVCDGIRKGSLIINDKEIVFKREVFFKGKLDFPVPDSFFEIKTNTDNNIVFLNDQYGVSFNGQYIEKCSKKQNFNVIKDAVDKNFKNSKVYMEWIDEGKFKLSDTSTIFYAAYRMPTSRGKLYNMLFMRNYKGTVMIGNYNYMEENMEEWKLIIEASVREMMFL